LHVLCAGYRAEDYGNHDRHVLLQSSVAILALDVPVNPARLERPAEYARSRAAGGIELLNEIR
jgi:hypothetical protein